MERDPPVAVDARVEFCDGVVSPGAADRRDDMAEYVALGDGAIDVGDHQSVRALQQVDVARAPGSSLKVIRAYMNFVGSCAHLNPRRDAEPSGVGAVVE